MAPTIPIKLTGRADAPALPALLSGASRAADGRGVEFLPSGYLRATGSFDVGAAARSVAGAAALQHDAAADEIVVLELADGGALVTSAQRLRDALQQNHPDWLADDGAIPFEKLRIGGRGAGARHRRGARRAAERRSITLGGRRDEGCHRRCRSSTRR
jgi:hypothetical protein